MILMKGSEIIAYAKKSYNFFTLDLAVFDQIILAISNKAIAITS